MALGAAGAGGVGYALSEKKELTFMDKHMIEHENKVRQNASPGKMFKNFSTVVRGEVEYMTPVDFVRSLIPSSYDPDAKPINMPKFASDKKAKAAPNFFLVWGPQPGRRTHLLHHISVVSDSFVHPQARPGRRLQNGRC